MSESVDHPNAGEDKDRKSRRFLTYWLWAWPAIGTWAITQHWFDPSAFERCPHVLFLAALIGTATTGWTLIRTRDRRYVPHLVVSIVLLCVGSTLFWNSFWVTQ